MGLSEPVVLGRTFPEEMLPPWEGRPVFSGISGSHGMGTNTDSSDFDYFAVWLHPKEHYLGLYCLPDSDRKGREVVYQHKKDDIDLVVMDVRYWFQQLMRLRLQFHRWLWLQPDLYFEPPPKYLLDLRYYISYHRSMGFALQQSGTNAINQALKTKDKEETKRLQVRGATELGLLKMLLQTGQLRLDSYHQELVKQIKADYPLTLELEEGIMVPPCRCTRMSAPPSRSWWNTRLLNLLTREYDK